MLKIVHNDDTKKIYFAGKISPLKDWRETIIPTQFLYDGDTWRHNIEQAVAYISLDADFPQILYMGPFLDYGKPHDYCDAIGHGTCNYHGKKIRSQIQQACLQSIDAADILFAWLDDTTAHGTLVEIGYAKAKGKTIWIAGIGFGKTIIEYGDDGTPYEIAEEIDPLWFVYEMADEILIGPDLTPKKALECFLLNPYEFNSPIEESFWNTWKRVQRHSNKRLILIPQHPISRYRVDFAHIETKTVIELDGLKSHSSTEDIAKDRKRQREIEALGWHVIRFGGKEIHADVVKCANEAYAIIDHRLSKEI